MDRKVIWSPHAAQSLENICSYIERDSFHYAQIFAQRIFSAIETIVGFPETGRIVPEFSKEDLREKIVGNYRVVYRLKKDVVEIVIITHGSRLLKL